MSDAKVIYRHHGHSFSNNKYKSKMSESVRLGKNRDFCFQFEASEWMSTSGNLSGPN